MNKKNEIEQLLTQKQRFQKQKIQHIINDTVVIGCMAYFTGVYLRRSTKINDVHIEEFKIEKVENPAIQKAIYQIFSIYKSLLQEEDQTQRKQFLSISYQHICLNCFIDFFELRGINVKLNKSLNKRMIVKKRNITHLNKILMEDYCSFGEALNYYIQTLIPVDCSDDESVFMLTKNDIIPILSQYPISFLS